MLTPSEETELQDLWRQVEQMNVARLESLTRLARLRSTDVRTLMRELGLSDEPGVFQAALAPAEPRGRSPCAVAV
jgi:hypothetical protein